MAYLKRRIRRRRPAVVFPVCGQHLAWHAAANERLVKR